jgi:hypothetical protein
LRSLLRGAFASAFRVQGWALRNLPFQTTQGGLRSLRFLLSGDEARKRAYLQQRLGGVFVDVSFSLAVADPRARALELAAVLQYKGRVVDAMADSCDPLLPQDGGAADPDGS